jgi:DNA-binding HxlR family transcriptional regulator
MRSYSQYCSIARSLDVIGDRWTLLIVRELLTQGACRYTDIRNGLPGIATNLLADRLRELEQAGVVQRQEAPPPVATTLFSLTPRGEELEPVLDALLRWGMPMMSEFGPDDVVRSRWLAGALESSLRDLRPESAVEAIGVDIGDEPILIEADSGAVRVAIGELVEDPDMTVAGPPAPVMGLLLGRLPLPVAASRGVTIGGRTSVLERFGIEERPA